MYRLLCCPRRPYPSIGASGHPAVVSATLCTQKSATSPPALLSMNVTRPNRCCPSVASLMTSLPISADAVGATKMDRPEWITTHPQTGEVYCALTNNSGRTTTDEANPRAQNRYGQIVRWREAGDDAAAMTFEWDLFVLAGNPVAYPDRQDLRSGSANVSADNTFNSPDGIGFDGAGDLLHFEGRSLRVFGPEGE